MTDETIEQEIQFTAAQAAQKVEADAYAVGGRVTAAQAAQKIPTRAGEQRCGFTAAQAAQK